MHPKRLLWFLTFLNLLNYIDRWIIASIIPPMQTELKMSNTAAGFVMSAFMLGYFLTSPFFGYLTDRFNRIKLIMVGTGLWSFATGLSGLGQSATQIFLSRTAVGVGEGSLVAASPSLIADVFPKNKLNKAMALLTATIPVGSALGFVLGGIIEHHYGWRMAFFAAGAPGLFFIVLFWIFIKEPTRGTFDSEKPKIKSENVFKDIKTLIQNKVYRNAVFGYTAFTFTVGGFASWAPKYLVSVRDVPLHVADSWFGALTVITGFTGTLAGGFIATKMSKKRKESNVVLILISTAIALPLVFLAFFLPTKGGFFISMGLAEFFLFMSQAPVNVIILESVGPLLRGMAMALSVFTIHLLGDFISPPLVGYLSDKTNLTIGILILPTALFFALFFYWRCWTFKKKASTTVVSIST